MGLKERSQWGHLSQAGALMRLARDRSRTEAGGAGAGAGAAGAAAAATGGVSEADELESVDAALRKEARAVERTISVCDLRRTGRGELTDCKG